MDGYPREVTVLPFGFGLRLKAHKNMDLIAEGTRRFTFTDYLDDVAGVYATRDEVIDWNGGVGSEKANIAVQLYDRSVEGGFRPIPAGRMRGSDNNDGYFIFTLGVELYLQRAKLQKSYISKQKTK